MQENPQPKVPEEGTTEGPSQRTAFGLLDLAVIVAESWLILLLLPALVGAAFFVVNTLHADYVAVAVSPLNATVSQTALGEIVDKALGPSDTRQIRMAAGNVTIVTQGQNADQVVAEARAAITALSEAPAYSDAQISETKQMLVETADELAAMESLFRKLQAPDTGARPADTTQAGSTPADIVAAAVALDDRIAEIRSRERELKKGLALRLLPTPDVDIKIQGGPRAALYTPILLTIATAMATFGLLLLRAMWVSASRDPLMAPKLARIRRSFFFSTGPE